MSQLERPPQTDEMPFSLDEFARSALALSERGFVTREYRDHTVAETPQGPRTYDRRYIVVAPQEDMSATVDDTGLGVNIAYGMVSGIGDERRVSVAFKTAEQKRVEDGVVHAVSVVRMNTTADFDALAGLLAVPSHERTVDDVRVKAFKDAAPAAFIAAHYMQFIH